MFEDEAPRHNQYKYHVCIFDDSMFWTHVQTKHHKCTTHCQPKGSLFSTLRLLVPRFMKWDSSFQNSLVFMNTLLSHERTSHLISPRCLLSTMNCSKTSFHSGKTYSATYRVRPKKCIPNPI